MVTKLNEISKLNGLSVKQLSEKANIKYTTLMTIAKKDTTDWDADYVNKVSKVLKMSGSEFIEQMSQKMLSPFIKWVGGKRQLLPELIEFVPKEFDTYFEPFIGGGALFFRLAPKNAVINDFNGELTNTYKVIRDTSEELSRLLKIHQKNDSKEYYLNIRSTDRDGRITKMTNIERASRFIYLNKAGFNGLWRVNAKGQNNVPYGSHKTLNLLPDFLTADSEYLSNNHVKILTGDYRDATQDAKTGDFVYFDPPYIPVTQTSNFTSYTKNGFGLIQQEELRDLAGELSNRGVKVMLSNSDTELTRKLYSSPTFKLHQVQASRSVNSNALKRGKIGELIITTY